MGFRDVDILEVDLRKWGGGEGISRIMIRDPKDNREVVEDCK
jgi:hypothetical protein